MIPIYDCSPAAKEKIKSYEDAIGVEPAGKTWAKYPFHAMPIGTAFVIPFDKANERSLRTRAAQQKPKIFVVIRHPEYQVFEVARIG